MKYILILSTFLSLSFFQTSTKTDIIGKWELIKETYQNKERQNNINSAIKKGTYKSTLVFEANGKYTNFFNKGSNIEGTWEIVGQNIITNNNIFVPPVPNGVHGNPSSFSNFIISNDTLIFDAQSELKGRAYYIKK
tara:strand:- start:53 stop:460 length:408 start_codon:yes stop_codon:yes gene_type:complete